MGWFSERPETGGPSDVSPETEGHAKLLEATIYTLSFRCAVLVEQWGRRTFGSPPSPISETGWGSNCDLRGESQERLEYHPWCNRPCIGTCVDLQSI
jgi:hypothetical protein